MARRKQDGIEIDEDLAHQRLEWRLAKLGALFLVIVLFQAVGTVAGMLFQAVKGAPDRLAALIDSDVDDLGSRHAGNLAGLVEALRLDLYADRN